MVKRPHILADMIAKWYHIIDILAHLLTVPSGLIMKTYPPIHCVVIDGNIRETPYHEQQVFELNISLYCDIVIQDKSLLVRTPT